MMKEKKTKEKRNIGGTGTEEMGKSMIMVIEMDRFPSEHVPNYLTITIICYRGITI